MVAAEHTSGKYNRPVCVQNHRQYYCCFSAFCAHNAYVRCLMIDFSKAFDSVDHVVLMSKVVQLNLPTFVINWICSFPAGRGQQCEVNGKGDG